MSKYKTIDGKVNRQSLQEAIENRLLSNRITRMTLENEQIQKALMSTNKSIIYIKLPKKAQKNTNFFKSHLYESSVKRLKQQKVTIFKQDKIPAITNKKNFQSFQEAVLRKIKERSIDKKEYFPQVFTSRGQQPDQSYINLMKPHQKIQQEQQDEGQTHPNIRHKRTSTFEIDGSVLGFKNLKEKYLELKQLSVNSKRKSELLQKHENKRYPFQEQFCQYDTKYKMQKQIFEHMNRYKKKDFFQTKVNGFKTILYPTNKSHSHGNKDYPLKGKKKEYSSYEKEEKKQVSNFIKRKKLRNYALHGSSEYPQKSFELKFKQQHQGSKQSSVGKLNPQQKEKSDMCTPWQTDFISFE